MVSPITTLLASGLGSSAAKPISAATIQRVEVRLLQLPIKEQLVASHGSHQVRELTVVRVTGDLHGSLSTGWGECAALPTAGYWPETAASSFDVIQSRSAELLGRSLTDITAAPGSATPMADAAIEMAIIDAALTEAGVSLAECLHVDADTVAAGATIGMADPAEVAARAEVMQQEGFRRIKIKIEPGHDVAVVRQLADRLGLGRDGQRPSCLLQVDANGSYTAEGIKTLTELADCGVHVIEQPFSTENLQAAADLRRQLAETGRSTLVLADESATTVDAAIATVEADAADGVVVKPSRLGGIAPTMHLLAAAGGASSGGNRFVVSIGGMLESGLGRHALAAIAAAASERCETTIGDLSPARRWLADDPWPDLDLRTTANGCVVAVPDGPGVAPDPDPDKLERYTIKRLTIE